MKKVYVVCALIFLAACSSAVTDSSFSEDDHAISAQSTTSLVSVDAATGEILVEATPVCPADAPLTFRQLLTVCVPQDCSVTALLTSGAAIEHSILSASTRYVMSSAQSGVVGAEGLARVTVNPASGLIPEPTYQWKVLQHGFFTTENAASTAAEFVESDALSDMISGVWAERKNLVFETDAQLDGQAEVLDFIIQGAEAYWSVVAELETNSKAAAQVSDYTPEPMRYDCYEYEVDEAVGDLSKTIVSCESSTVSDVWVQDYACENTDPNAP